MKLKIRYIGPSTNVIYAGIHWRKRKAHADEAHLIAKMACKGLPKITKPVNLIFHPYHNNRVLYDTSNYSYTAKLLEDGMVKGGLLANDNNKHVQGFAIKPAIKTKGESYMIIDIVEVK